MANFPVPSEEDLNQLLKNTWTSDLRDGYLTQQNCVLPQLYLDMKNDIDNFEVMDTDVWICGFPKTGTTWISEIAWLIVHDFDYEGAKEVDYKRTRMLEFSMLFNPKRQVLFGGEQFEVDSVAHAANQPNPRTIKSHLPYSLLPKQIVDGTRSPKMIYTARNAMDTCISYYHQCKNFEGFIGTFEDFCKLFLYDKVNYGPYPEHVLSFWERRNQPNVLFVTYEEMQENLIDVIDKVAKFLGKSVTEEQKKKLSDYVSFDTMKKNPAVNKQVLVKEIEAGGRTITPFIRKGKAGGYKDVMSAEIINEFRYRVSKKLANSGLSLLDQ